jgi:hypothetical protein
LLTAAPGPYDGYDAFLNALVAETQAFDGQVVLVHGDTHFFKMDKPLVDQAHLDPQPHAPRDVRKPQRPLGQGDGRSPKPEPLPLRADDRRRQLSH